MNRRTTRILTLSAAIALTALPLIALAQSCDPSRQLCSPLNSSFNSIPQFLAGVLQAIVKIALPFIALAFVYSGVMFAMARGNEQKLAVAKRNFLYSAVGAALILGAWVLAMLIAGTVQQIMTG